jgi:hypothetical protein
MDTYGHQPLPRQRLQVSLFECKRAQTTICSLARNSVHRFCASARLEWLRAERDLCCARRERRADGCGRLGGAVERVACWHHHPGLPHRQHLLPVQHAVQAGHDALRTPKGRIAITGQRKLGGEGCVSAEGASKVGLGALVVAPRLVISTLRDVNRGLCRRRRRRWRPRPQRSRVLSFVHACTHSCGWRSLSALRCPSQLIQHHGVDVVLQALLEAALDCRAPCRLWNICTQGKAWCVVHR